MSCPNGVLDRLPGDFVDKGKAGETFLVFNPGAEFFIFDPMLQEKIEGKKPIRSLRGAEKIGKKDKRESEKRTSIRRKNQETKIIENP